MKQYLITLIMLLTLATTTQAAAQKHRHTPKRNPVTVVTPVAPTPQDTASTVEAFSDTTSVADEDSLSYQQPTRYNIHYTADWDSIGTIMEGVGQGLVWAVFALIALLILFVLAPVVIIIAIFYFINKNRKDKLKLAQMAIQHGQPIPEQLIRERPKVAYNVANNNFRSGVKQMFLGVGLFIMLGLIFGKLGYGIGALVFFIGLGKLVIAAIDKENEKKVYDIPYRYAANEQPKPADNGAPTPAAHEAAPTPAAHEAAPAAEDTTAQAQTPPQTPPSYNNVEPSKEKED